MIRTKQPQVLDSINRVEEVVYMFAENMTENDKAETVTFDSVLQILVNEVKPIQVEKKLLNEQGDEYIVFENELWVFPKFIDFLRRKSTYKMSTFDALFNNLTRSQFKSQKDYLMIQEINTVNSTICNPLQKNCNYFWYLTSNDMEVLTELELTELLAPYKLEA